VEVQAHYEDVWFVEPPGTVDGGDVCQIQDHFLIGLSARTNEHGADQLSRLLRSAGFTSSQIDLSRKEDLLHLKSGISYLGGGCVLVTDALFGHGALKNMAKIKVPDGEEYAANCIRVNDWLLVAAGFPRTAEKLQSLGYKIMEVEMSEFQKMDGGLSCLSLRF
jgi:dimethylargininase